LALVIGCLPSELLDRIATSELMELYVYDSMYPIGDHGAYLRNANVVGTLASDGKKSHKLEDFMIPEMIHSGRSKRPQSAEDMFSILTQQIGMAGK